MFKFQSLRGSIYRTDYEKKKDIVISIYNAEQWYGSIFMMVLVVAFAAYCIKNRNTQRFELTILVLLFLKYFVAALNQANVYSDYQHNLGN